MVATVSLETSAVNGDVELGRASLGGFEIG